jgi:hypothetical protein
VGVLAFLTFLKTRKVVFGSVTVGKNNINYQVKDGLNKFHLVSMYKDNKGSLWFGTSDYDYLSLTGKALKDSKSSKKEQTKARPEN